MHNKNLMISLEVVEKCILIIRGQKVMSDFDLAKLYEVPIKRMNEQVRRNRKRFPPDFMFQLSSEEAKALRSQNATLDMGRGKHRKYLPFVFYRTGSGHALYSSSQRPSHLGKH